ncbi:MAG TPA: ABC transporter permease subunit, partial [Acidothermaceae bacterium]|nr:ABC transporter permease subunit [Acidothermaceae bacterium]
MTDVATNTAEGRIRGADPRARVPYALFVPAAIGVVFLILPIAGLLIRTPWHQLPSLISSPDVRTALRLSLETATAATAIAIVLGVPIAWVLARLEFRGRALLRALITLPLVLPPVAGGIALLLAYGRRGVVGSEILSVFGVSLPFTTAAVIVAETFVAMPFLIVSVEGSLRGVDVRYDHAAATLGASRLFTFVHVTLPMLGPGIAAGAVLCWARA